MVGLSTNLADFHHHIAAGRAARRHGNASEALAQFAAAMKHDKRQELSVLEYAEELRRHDRIAEAESMATDVVARCPDSAPALLLLARCARGKRPAAECIIRYRRAVEAAPSDPAPLTELAHEQRKAGQLAEADMNYLAALSLAPGRIFPLRGLAQCARARADVAASLEWNRRAHLMAPSDLSTLIEIAKDLFELDRLQEAFAAYEKILAAEPESFPALMGHAAACARLGDTARAQECYRQAQRLRPADTAPLTGEIGLYRDSGDLVTAERLAHVLVDNHPGKGWLQLGWIQRVRADHAAAFTAFATAHEASSTDIDSIVQMAVEARAMGDAEGCERLFGYALTLDPTHAGALVQSALHALSVNRHEEALALFLQTLEAGKQIVPSTLGACETLLRLGRSGEALNLLSQIAERVGWTPSLIGRRITLLREVGEAQAALIEAEMAIPQCRRHGGLFVAIMKILLLYAGQDRIDACLACFEPVTERERLLHATMTGFSAEEQGDMLAAAQAFDLAARLRPQDAGVWLDITRLALLRLDPAEAAESMRRNRSLGEGELRTMGYSSNISQTHYGQMIDEYRMDTVLLGKLRAALELNIEEKDRQLRRLARNYPDSTLVAVAVLEMMTAGAAGLPPAAINRLIPANIIQFWDAPEPPDDVAILMESWITQNPQHRYTRLSDHKAKLMLWNEFGRAAACAYRRARQPAHKADLLRLAILLMDGGIYADADDRCIAPVETLIGEHDTLVLHREDLGTLGNNFIAVTAGHPVIRRALDQAVLATNRGDADLLWFATGPGLITRSVVAELAKRDRDGRLPGLRILSRRDLHCAVAAHCRTAYKKTEKHWENTSFKRTAASQAAEA